MMRFLMTQVNHLTRYCGGNSDEAGRNLGTVRYEDRFAGAWMMRVQRRVDVRIILLNKHWSTNN